MRGGALLVFGAIHLAVVATFTVTEDLVLPPRVRLARRDRPSWRQVIAPLQPGGGSGAIYVLLQMALLLFVGWLLGFRPCSTGSCSPAATSAFSPARLSSSSGRFGRTTPRRFACASPCSCCSPGRWSFPTSLAYMLWQPNGLDLNFSVRHLLNPFRTLANFRHAAASYTVLAELIGVVRRARVRRAHTHRRGRRARSGRRTLWKLTQRELGRANILS